MRHEFEQLSQSNKSSFVKPLYVCCPHVAVCGAELSLMLHFITISAAVDSSVDLSIVIEEFINKTMGTFDQSAPTGKTEALKLFS